MMQDITAEATDSHLTVPKNVNVTLDMNSYTLSRGLTEAKKDGSVIFVYGTLEITGGGVITGGYSTGLGGGIWFSGKDYESQIHSVTGGSITDNIAAREWDYMKMRDLIALTNRSFRCYNRAKKHAEGTDSHAIQNQKQPLAAGLAARIFYGLSR